MFGPKYLVCHRIVPGVPGDRDQRHSRNHNFILFAVDRRSGDIPLAPQIASDHGHALHPVDLFSRDGPDLMEREKTTGEYQIDVDIQFFDNVARIPGFYTQFVQRLPRIETTILSCRLVDMVFLFKLQLHQIAEIREIRRSELITNPATRNNRGRALFF